MTNPDSILWMRASILLKKLVTGKISWDEFDAKLPSLADKSVCLEKLLNNGTGKFFRKFIPKYYRGLIETWEKLVDHEYFLDTRESNLETIWTLFIRSDNIEAIEYLHSLYPFQETFPDGICLERKNPHSKHKNISIHNFNYQAICWAEQFQSGVDLDWLCCNGLKLVLTLALKCKMTIDKLRSYLDVRQCGKCQYVFEFINACKITRNIGANVIKDVWDARTGGATSKDITYVLLYDAAFIFPLPESFWRFFHQEYPEDFQIILTRDPAFAFSCIDTIPFLCDELGIEPKAEYFDLKKAAFNDYSLGLSKMSRDYLLRLPSVIPAPYLELIFWNLVDRIRKHKEPDRAFSFFQNYREKLLPFLPIRSDRFNKLAHILKSIHMTPKDKCTLAEIITSCVRERWEGVFQYGTPEILREALSRWEIEDDFVFERSFRAHQLIPKCTQAGMLPEVCRAFPHLEEEYPLEMLAERILSGDERVESDLHRENYHLVVEKLLGDARSKSPHFHQVLSLARDSGVDVTGNSWLKLLRDKLLDRKISYMVEPMHHRCIYHFLKNLTDTERCAYYDAILHPLVRRNFHPSRCAMDNYTIKILRLFSHGGDYLSRLWYLMIGGIFAKPIEVLVWENVHGMSAEEMLQIYQTLPRHTGETVSMVLLTKWTRGKNPFLMSSSVFVGHVVVFYIACVGDCQEMDGHELHPLVKIYPSLNGKIPLDRIDDKTADNIVKSCEEEYLKRFSIAKSARQ